MSQVFLLFAGENTGRSVRFPLNPVPSDAENKTQQHEPSLFDANERGGVAVYKGINQGQSKVSTRRDKHSNVSPWWSTAISFCFGLGSHFFSYNKAFGAASTALQILDSFYFNHDNDRCRWSCLQEAQGR